jgi:uncharacterized lipoprotein YehR (DUF1307 family)
MFGINYKYLIKYTNENGERKTYMNIGFDTLERAENELRKIKEQREKLKGIGAYLNRTDNYGLNRACISGKNFRIKKVSIIVHDLIFKNQFDNL